MAKITVSLKKKNQSGTGQGFVDIVSQSTLSSIIDIGGISVDEEKLQGIDNFMISERRANCSIKLLKQNVGINNALINSLTNEDNRIQDNLPVTYIPTCTFSMEKLLEQTSDERLFARHFEGIHQTGQDKMLVIPSKEMLDIVYTAFRDAPTAPTSRWDITPKVTNTVGGYKFNNTIYQLLAFLGRTCQIHASSSETVGMATTVNNTKTYLNSLYPNLGNDIESFLNSKIIVESSLQRYGLEHLYTPFTKIGNNIYNTMIGVFTLIGEYLDADGWKVLAPSGDALFIPTGSVATELMCAIVLSSLFNYDAYYLVKTKMALANNDAKELRLRFDPLKKISYIPFYMSREIVQRYNSDSPGQQKKNIFWDNGIAVSEFRTMLPESVGMFQVMLGKPQSKTEDGSNDGSIQTQFIIPSQFQERYNNEDLFIPVSRTYTASPNTFATNTPIINGCKVLINNIDTSRLFNVPETNFFYMAQYMNTNWMFFDNITAREIYSPISINVDNIPIFDPSNQSHLNEFGSYIFKEDYASYYTKEPSSLMNILLEIYSDGIKIYSGLVDFNSVSISRNSIDFTTTDAIGLLIENMKKLNGIVEFSQFDRDSNLVADWRAGSNIRDFIDSIVSSPFPYKPYSGFTSTNIFDEDQALYSPLKNKVLKKITPEEALLIGVQVTKKLLYCDGDGKILLKDIEENQSPRTIPQSSIISMSYKQEMGNEVFSPDKIKLLAGNEMFAADIANTYNTYRAKINKTITITLSGNSNIKMLDKISVDGKLWIVVRIQNDLLRNKKEITAIGV